jgi:hypothetical protein
MGFYIQCQSLRIFFFFLLHGTRVVLLDELGILYDLQQLQGTGIPAERPCLIE